MTAPEEDRIHVEKFMSFVRSGLASLYMHMKDNPQIKTNRTKQNHFLGKWVQSAQKRKVFDRSLSEQIKMFSDQYKKRGALFNIVKEFHDLLALDKAAELQDRTFDKIEYERFICLTQKLEAHNYDFRFPLDPNDPNNDNPPRQSKVAFSLKADWDASIQESGAFNKPLRCYISPPLQLFVDEAFDQGFFVLKQSEKEDEQKNIIICADLYPHNMFTTHIEIPTKCQL